MASIRKKGPFQYHVQIRRKGFPHVTQTFETRPQAEAWARGIEAEMDRGVFVDRSEAEATTLYDALDRYKREISAKKDGHAQEKVRINQWQNDKLALRSLASLRGADFAKWRDNRLKAVSPSTCQKDLAVISHLYTVAAKEWGLPVVNPISSIKVPSEDNSRDRRLKGDDEKRLLEQLKPIKGRSPWMIPLVQLAIETAARQSELLALDWSDVDYMSASIRIRGKERTDGKRRTKNRDKFRDVPMSPAAAKILKALPGSREGKVFPVSAQVVRNAYIQAVKRAKIEDLTFHDLRHEGTSRLAEIYNMQRLMKITGHSSSRMLSRYYHPTAEELAKPMWLTIEAAPPTDIEGLGKRILFKDIPDLFKSQFQEFVADQEIEVVHGEPVYASHHWESFVQRMR